MSLHKITVIEASFTDGNTSHHVYLTESTEAEAQALATRLRGRSTRRGRIERVEVAPATRTSLAQIDSATR
jgi:hypothetical protein